MKFTAVTLVTMAFAIGVSAVAPIVSATVGTFTTSTDPDAEALTVVLETDTDGSQPLNGPIVVNLSTADLPAPFNQVTCSFTTAQGPPDANTGSPTCDLDTKIADASTQDGFSPNVEFTPPNVPFCVFCSLETSASKKHKRAIRDL